MKLAKSFYARSALTVAPKLLGKLLVRNVGGVRISGRIVEVEAYMGSEDPASHGFRGKTERNAVMFGPAGRTYVYFTYGNHFCVNVVTGREGKASAVLLRALEPREGLPFMCRRRKKRRVTDLASGPGKLSQALAIDRKLNGADLGGKALWIEMDPKRERISRTRSGRVGISAATELQYRFYIAGSPFVSKGRPGPAARKRSRQIRPKSSSKRTMSSSPK
ncbi:MAG: DNA-3-methyladenine glycosylase [Pseudomonadota bacterium]